MEEKRTDVIEEPNAIRAMRIGSGDEGMFWFRDDLHNPYPISPLGLSTVRRGHMWGFARAAEEAKLPGSRGPVVKTHNHRIYYSFVNITDPEVIGERAKHFGPFVHEKMDNWEVFYGGAMKEAEKLTVPLAKTDTSKFTYEELAEQMRKCHRAVLRCWYLHFITMYVASANYMGGEHFAQNYGVDEQDYAMMLRGFQNKSLESDEGQYKLTKSAVDKPGVLSLFEGDESMKTIMEKMKGIDEGKAWLKELQAYLNEYGHRSIAAIVDVNFPTWYEAPATVVENIRNMVPRIKDGWDFAEERKKTVEVRDEAIEKFRKMLKPEDVEPFEKGLPQWQKAHAFNEDHWFYTEQMCWSGLRYTALEVGKRFAKEGILENPDDVFFLTYEEIIEALDSCVESSDVAGYTYSYLLRPLVNDRRKESEEAAVKGAQPFFGTPPEKVEDPLAIKVFGMTDFVLEKARKEMAGEKVDVGNTLKGFPGSPGVIEGPARVITSHEDFPKLKTGDILVCPYTAPAWTPIFPKIRGVVTDSGGMLTHAAITAREYGIPAVVGTWVATSTINNGDTIRIDGTKGVVEIVSGS